MKANDKAYKAYIYPGANHGFHNDTTPRYDQAAAELAWSPTLDFFKENLSWEAAEKPKSLPSLLGRLRVKGRVFGGYQQASAKSPHPEPVEWAVAVRDVLPVAPAAVGLTPNNEEPGSCN